ncbi:hypothetical protein BaOVIS_018220 [Babesia ovis]|uniref:PH domain-containing protein n=1 Tax=Babesia ovis TaxID=5869 RepID=A0A9W5WUZ3_BABOV|nr:hypothetical protein BaOVIS_018220 [Babesia ovis]
MRWRPVGSLEAAAVLALSVTILCHFLDTVAAINRPGAADTLNADVPSPKEANLADAEINTSQGVRSLDDEIRNHEILDLGRQEDFFLSNRGNGCDVLVEDVIDVALEPRDMLKTQQFVGSITPNELRLYLKERSKDPGQPTKPGKLFARFSLGAIVTPLETVSSSRDCFRMFYKKEPILFCAKDTNHRDFWMHTIVKAKFCHTAHTVLSKASLPAEGAAPAKLPDLTTKPQRLHDLLHPKSVSGEAVVGPHNDNKITNIDIKNVDSGEPEIYLNGEAVKSDTVPKDQGTLLKEQSERRQQDVA